MACIIANTSFALSRNESLQKCYLSLFDFGWNLTKGVIIRFIKARPVHDLIKPTQIKIAAVLRKSVKPRNQNPNPIQKEKT